MSEPWNQERIRWRGANLNRVLQEQQEQIAELRAKLARADEELGRAFADYIFKSDQSGYDIIFKCANKHQQDQVMDLLNDLLNVGKAHEHAKKKLAEVQAKVDAQRDSVDWDNRIFWALVCLFIFLFTCFTYTMRNHNKTLIGVLEEHDRFVTEIQDALTGGRAMLLGRVPRNQ